MQINGVWRRVPHGWWTILIFHLLDDAGFLLSRHLPWASAAFLMLVGLARLISRNSTMNSGRSFFKSAPRYPSIPRARYRYREGAAECVAPSLLVPLVSIYGLDNSARTSLIWGSEIALVHVERIRVCALNDSEKRKKYRVYHANCYMRKRCIS